MWDTVPPRMAQRIFAGMLNETLTILTVRYCQVKFITSYAVLLATRPSYQHLLIRDTLFYITLTSMNLPRYWSSNDKTMITHHIFIDTEIMLKKLVTNSL